MSALPPNQHRLYAAFWLIYVGFIFLEPYLARAPLASWLWAVLSVAVFLPMYFAVFTYPAGRMVGAGLTVAMASLGLAMVPWNIGGSTYVIFSAAVAPFLFERRLAAAAYIVGAAAVLAVAIYATRDPHPPWMFVQPVIVLMVGGGNMVAAEERRSHLAVRRAQEEVEEMAKLAERERIARDLHDVLGHTLSVIALKSELAAKLSAIDPERAFQEIREVERVSRTALSEVRHAVEGYRGHGLRGEIESAGRALGAAGVRLDTDVAPVQLPPKQETVLALAVREAITNVVRHANATMCRISLRQHDGHVVLRIEDDGVGGVPLEGNGLTGMRERVAAIGGTLDVSGSPGFLLTVTV